MFYFDYAATHPMDTKTLDYYKEVICTYFANSESSHKLGIMVSSKIEECRKNILNLMPKDMNLIFVSSASEANNIITNCLDYNSSSCSPSDHPSLSKSIKNVTYYKHLKNGEIDFESIPNVDFVNITHLNSYSGVLTELSPINKKWKHLHIDAAQSFGKNIIDYSSFHFDSLTLSGHKLGAPIGIAALVFKKGLKLTPFIKGGGQEYNIRSSTINAPAILTLNFIINELKKESFDISDHLNFLKKELKEFATPWLKNSQIFPILIKDIPADIIMRHLEMKDIIVSTGSACSSKIKGIKDFYLAMHLEEKFHKNILRISFSRKQTINDLKFLVDNIKKTYQELKNLHFKP